MSPMQRALPTFTTLNFNNAALNSPQFRADDEHLISIWQISIENKRGQSGLLTFLSNIVWKALINQYLLIPLDTQVRGPYGKFWTEFFPAFVLWPKRVRSARTTKARKKKNEDP